MHPTAARFQERARALGLDVHVEELAESTRTAADAAVGCELGQIVKSMVLRTADGDPLLCLCAATAGSTWPCWARGSRWRAAAR